MSANTTVRTGHRRALISRDEAVRLAAGEYGRFAALLRGLGPGDWDRPTDCSEWDVRQMAAHVLGMAEMVAAVRSFVRQNALAARAGGGVDALTALQVRERADLSPDEIVARFTAAPPGPCGVGAGCPGGSDGCPCPRSRLSVGAPSTGGSATSSTSSSRATRGCTASTSPVRPGGNPS